MASFIWMASGARGADVCIFLMLAFVRATRKLGGALATASAEVSGYDDAAVVHEQHGGDVLVGVALVADLVCVGLRS